MDGAADRAAGTAAGPQAEPIPALPAPLQLPDTRPPLVSSLPTEDPDFAEIVVEFADRLNQQLGAIQTAWERRELGELASLAHWLKGSGGTAGFPAFTAPAAEIERRAKSDDLDDIARSIQELTDLASRIVIPASPPSAGSPATTHAR